MKNYKSLTLIILVFVLSVFVGTASAEKPRNIIFLIGDGMGIAHITATRLFKGELALERFKIMGLHMTHSSDSLVTDSAAAGTALATGHRTNTGMLGLCPDGNKLKNLFEYALEAGKKTGIVVTCTMPHATPAAFSSHVPSRRHTSTIAKQQVRDSGMSLIISGGMRYLLPKSVEGSRRIDELDLLSELKERMPVVKSFEDLMELEDTNKAAAIIDMGMLPRSYQRDYDLGQLTAKGIEILNNYEDGFVIMVEGAQIDFAGHENNVDWIIHEMVDFDKAVKAALDFAEKDGDTLVVVTSDHETGGFTIPEVKLPLEFARKSGKTIFVSDDGSEPEKTDENYVKIVKPAFSTTEHSGEMVPVFAYGPGAEIFGGIQDITDVGQKLIDLLK